MEVHNNDDLLDLKLALFSCRSIKSSIYKVRMLCDNNDIVCIQEQWLLPNELHILSTIHPKFVATGLSDVNISKVLLVGRPYGGTAIMYRQTFINSIKVIDSKDSRISGIIAQSRYGPSLILCVTLSTVLGCHVSTNSGDDDCLERYVDTCSSINAIYIDSDSVNCIVIGDINCQQVSCFYTLFIQLGSDINLILSDINRLSDDTFTYRSDVGLTCHGLITYYAVQ